MTPGVMTVGKIEWVTTCSTKRIFSVDGVNGGERGTIEWDGVSPMFVTLKDIPKSAKVQVGDSVETSPTSSLFPGNLMVGTIAEIMDDKSSNFYSLKVKPATNFFNIEYVYVIANTQYLEQKRLEDSTRKKFQ
jgi:rod shape-determining protein MreC